ncbi:MAG: hypothetical protein JRE64_02745 [Deltaproteobacteria bacterium]|nr:hypothetical protein [Deltaproteobacteria bacterium]MBW2737771.1 hypothetical protein [Deltaproteobacteria bacterium]
MLYRQQNKTGNHSKIIYESLPSDDPKQRKPDITLAKEELDWEPKIKLEDGLVKTIGYFKGLLSSGLDEEVMSESYGKER